CGFYTGHAQHVSSIYTFSLFPWVLWRFDVALVTGRWWPAAQSGALWGLSALGGYPELVILTAGFLFVWTVARCSVRFPDTIADRPAELASAPPAPRRGLASLAIVAVVGTVVLLPPYVAFFAEGHGYSDRVGPRSRQEAVTSNATPTSAFLTFASTYLTDLRMPDYHNLALWPKSDVSLTNVYLGSLIPILAVFVIIYGPRSPAHWFLVAITVFCFACAVGGQLPLRGWLYDLLPPTRYFRNPSLFRQYGMFSIALLALWASEDLRLAIRQPLSRAWKYLTVTAGVLTGAAALAYLYIASIVNHRGALFPQATRDSALIWISAFAATLVCWRVPRTRKLFPAMLVFLAIGHAFWTIRLARPTMSSSRSSREVWTRLDAAHTRQLDVGLQRQVAPPLWIGAFANNENLPLKIPTFFNYETMTNRFQEDFLHHPVLLAMSTGESRIWFSSLAATVSPSDALYAAFVQRSNQLGVPIVVVHPRAKMADLRLHNERKLNDAELEAIEHLPPAQRISAHLLRYTPNHLDLQVNCPAPGWLLVTDRWANGWQATVNGTPADLFGADFIFRAVRTNAGSNVVKFSYRPAGWPWLLALSWALLAAVLVSTVVQLAVS
ncbi:MAG TPA: hypothetical protein VKB60_05080, partial [Terriglobales bacterium]|nr:hypothetical protein [Terriglobales bacterium]